MLLKSTVECVRGRTSKTKFVWASGTWPHRSFPTQVLCQKAHCSSQFEFTQVDKLSIVTSRVKQADAPGIRYEMISYVPRSRPRQTVAGMSKGQPLCASEAGPQIDVDLDVAIGPARSGRASQQPINSRH
eukprot:362548-Chlamydomonas_euryale.AAC.17